MTKRLMVLFASGVGSNVQQILARQSHNPQLQCMALVCDTPAAPIMQCNLGIPKVLVNASDYAHREAHETAIIDAITHITDGQRPDWALLCGYKRLIGQRLLSYFWNPIQQRHNIVNIHPSPLPDYPGLNSYQRMYADNTPYGGVTLHFVDAGMDTGPIIFSERFPRDPHMSLAAFIQTGQNKEYDLYERFLTHLDHYDT